MITKKNYLMVNGDNEIVSYLYDVALDPKFKKVQEIAGFRFLEIPEAFKDYPKQILSVDMSDRINADMAKKTEMEADEAEKADEMKRAPDLPSIEQQLLAMHLSRQGDNSMLAAVDARIAAALVKVPVK